MYFYNEDSDQKFICKQINRKNNEIYIQGNSNSTSIIEISETIGDTRMIKLGQSCAFMCLTICRLETCKIPSSSGDIREKPIIADFDFIFFWRYLTK